MVQTLVRIAVIAKVTSHDLFDADLLSCCLPLLGGFLALNYSLLVFLLRLSRLFLFARLDELERGVLGGVVDALLF